MPAGPPEPEATAEAKDGRPADDHSAESVRRSTAFALGVQLTTAVFTAVLMLYIVRALGPDEYGLFALALATGGLLAVPADLGITASTSRFVAERRGDREGMVAAIAAGFGPKLLASVLVSVGLFASSGWIASAYGNEALTWPLRASAFVFFGQTLFLFFQRSFIAQGRIGPNLRNQLVESSVETVASIALVALGAGATGAMFGRAAGYVVGAAFALFMTVRLVGRAAVRVDGRFGVLSRRIVRYAGPLIIVDSAFAIFSQIDAVLIGVLLSTASVGLFQAPNRLITFLGYPGAAIANAVAPRFVRRPEAPPELGPLQASLRYLIIFQGALMAPLLVWSQPIVDLLLGSRYGESATVLRALTPYVFFTGIAFVVTLVPNYLGIARQRIPIVLVTVGVNVVIDLLLIPRIGIVGGAIGTDIAYTFFALAHLWVCQRALDLPIRPLVEILLRTALAAAAMAGLLLLIGTGNLSPAQWAAGVIGSPLVFVAVLLATREIAPDELRALYGFFARRLRRA